MNIRDITAIVGGVIIGFVMYLGGNALWGFPFGFFLAMGVAGVGLLIFEIFELRRKRRG